jgi:hypothetical protein
VYVLSLLVLTSALATEIGAVNSASDRPPPLERTSYTGKDAPAGIRLKVFLGWFRLDHEDRDLIIKQKLVDGQFRAEDLDNLLIYFDELSHRVEAEIAEEMWHIACHEEAAKLNGIEIRAVWNALGDLREGTYAKYVAIASGELAALGYVDFPEKLEIMEAGFSSSEFDYRDNEWISDEQLFEARPGICKGIEHKLSSDSD